MRRASRLALLRAAAAAALAAASLAAGASEPGLSEAGRRMLDDVRRLCSADFAGRRAGTPGGEAAAGWVAREFRAAGLLPGGAAGSYLSPFTFVDGAVLGPGNRLATAAAAPVSREWAVEADFRPLALSASGEVEAEVVFAGYGISAPSLGWDDWAGLDVTGKAVLVVRGGPDGERPESPFSPFFPLWAKAEAARSRGASALLVAPADGDALVSLHTDLDFEPGPLPSVSVRRRVAEALFAGSGTTAARSVESMRKLRRPASRPLPKARVRLKTDLKPRRATAANVVGLLPGRDPARNREALVVGAHYDHLGAGGPGSLDRSGAPRLHPGADDNASGVALLLELARSLTRRRGELPRSVLFVAFGAEEQGALGSQRFVAQPPLPLPGLVAMLNLDMVGRLSREGLLVRGVGSSPRLPSLVSAAAEGTGLPLRLSPHGWSPSDHAPFYDAGRPVLFLFTGYHDDYHRPEDGPDRIDVRGMERVLSFAKRLALLLAAEPAPLPFSRVEGDRLPAPLRRAGAL